MIIDVQKGPLYTPALKRCRCYLRLEREREVGKVDRHLRQSEH